MFIGIDIGTSGVKTVLLSRVGAVVDSFTSPLSVSRPQDLWSEQKPEDWWQATINGFAYLAEKHDLKQVKAIGLTGQMHGAVLLDTSGQVLRPAILWNDGRSYLECQELEAAVPEIHSICGNLIMPGFTAPKLLWVKKHEPEIFAQIKTVLLPKDYIRFRMTGEFASDMSDAAGTMWLDVAKRDWSDAVLKACSLSRTHMPKLYEGTEVTGTITPSFAQANQLDCIPVVAGASDNSAGAIGVGLTQPGQAMISLGTSGVYFVVSDGYLSNPESAVHSFCHSLPQTWHLMSVILSAASCLDWVSRLTGYASVAEMLQAVEQTDFNGDGVFFLPYLSGERTPHNNPHAKGVFFGMTHETKGVDLCRAVLEGVGFAFKDGVHVLEASGIHSDDISLIGGGARSDYWRQMLADILGRELTYRDGGDVGPALGAARLAQIAIEGIASVQQICPVPTLKARHHPIAAFEQYYVKRYVRWQKLYEQLKESFI